MVLTCVSFFSHAYWSFMYLLSTNIYSNLLPILKMMLSMFLLWVARILHVITTTTKPLQWCPTLCNAVDSSPPSSPVPRILQARTLEWVAISFSRAWKWKVKVKSLSRAQLLATPWTAAYQAPPSMGFSRQEYWSGVPLPSPFMLLEYKLFIYQIYIKVKRLTWIGNQKNLTHTKNPRTRWFHWWIYQIFKEELTWIFYTCKRSSSKK